MPLNRDCFLGTRPSTPAFGMITEVDKTEMQWNVGLKLEELSE